MKWCDGAGVILTVVITSSVFAVAFLIRLPSAVLMYMKDNEQSG